MDIDLKIKGADRAYYYKGQRVRLAFIDDKSNVLCKGKALEGELSELYGQHFLDTFNRIRYIASSN